MRDGDLVLTPGEFGRVVGDASGPMVVVDHNSHYAVYPRNEVEEVVGVSERDVLRVAIAALLEAVTKRMEQLEAAGVATHFASERDIYTACRSDLAEVAESLRLMLTVPLLSCDHRRRMTMREVYVLMRDVGEYEDRDESPVLATLDKGEAEAWLACARAFAWPGRCDIFDDEHDNCAPPWETADALRKVRTYGEPTYRLVTVRLTEGDHGE